jgi:predicted negative regulator of RcsB-dependent stress response
MKRKLLYTLLLCLTALPSFSQPKFAAKVSKGVVSLNTYDRQGNLMRQGTAVFVGANGEAIADYRLFKNAYQASVIDASGKQLDVDVILGADDTYSMVRFHVNTKGNAVIPSVTASQPMKSTVYVLGRTDGGQLGDAQAAVADTAMIQGKYVYYGLDKPVDETLIGAPVFNESGTLVGMLHPQIGNKNYVLDIRFRNELKIQPFPSTSASVALGNIFIPKALPETQEEALVYLYTKSRSASNEEYMDMVNRFVATYPKNAEGYLRRATPLIDLTRFDEADKDLQQYLSLVDDKAVGNYNVASLIFDKLRLQPEPAYEKWNMDVALQYVDKALSLNASKPDEERKLEATRYRVLKGQLLMEKPDYDGALAVYEELSSESGGAPSYLYAISMAREGRGDSIEAVMEPIDSAIAKFGTPMPSEAASYIIRRGQLYANNGQYREAVQDYNQYAYLLNQKVSPVFYYERSQIEVNARMYQPAMDDINKAIEQEPREPLYYVTRASLAVRVSMFDECIESCQNALRLNPDIIDAYRIMGYAQLQKGDKTSARQNLQKAIDMGDEAARMLMNTYLAQ